RLALLRIPPRPLPDHLEPVGRRARRREQRDLIVLHRGVQVLILAQQRLRKTFAQLALADGRHLGQPAVDRRGISGRRRTVAIERPLGDHSPRFLAHAPPVRRRIGYSGGHSAALSFFSIFAFLLGSAANTVTASPRAWSEPSPSIRSAAPLGTPYARAFL